MPQNEGSTNHLKVTQRDKLAEMHDLAKKRQGRCLSELYSNNKTKLQWQCQNNHVWEAVPHAIRAGTWCPFCAGKIKGSIEEMRSLAKKRGGDCLSAVYISRHHPLEFTCRRHHKWRASPTAIIRGQWCPACFGNQKGSIEKMQQRAAEMGGDCLSKIYINENTKLTWRCRHGHVWQAVPGNIKTGHWCPVCGRLKSIERRRYLYKQKITRLIKDRGRGLWSEYKNAKQQMRWKCHRGHVWSATPYSVLKGGWCPLCFKKVMAGDAPTIKKTKELCYGRGLRAHPKNSRSVGSRGEIFIFGRSFDRRAVVKQAESKNRVMVLDDNDVILEFLKDYYTAKNCEVLCFDSADKALITARHHQFDLALVDVNLGNQMNGISFIRAMKKQQPSCCFQAMTGYSDLLNSSNHALARLGVDGVWSKPYTAERLNSILDVLKKRNHELPKPDKR
ncbi:MAG: response regulator [Deltaproteobacteria bacterium]|nr:response regulator [Deltaproteobacteria bacterium]